MIILQVIYVFNVDIMRVIKIEYGENRQKKKNMVSYKLGQVRLFFFSPNRHDKKQGDERE